LTRQNSLRPFGTLFVFSKDEGADRRTKITLERGEHMATTTEEVWEAFHTPLQQFIRRRVSDEDTAEDVLQEVFLKIHQQMSTLRDVKKLESWIYQVTRNAIIDVYRSKRPTTTLEAAESLELPEALPDDDIVSELLPCVRAMVRSLPEQDRQALVLTEYQGLTQKELAERLGLSFSGAKSRVQRAREKLKQQLLECCHFELDRRGHILDYQPRCPRCETAGCCTNEPLMPTRLRQRASFLEPLRLYEQNQEQ
jgi:RNA polymerase sigma-70 factor (ECF subfamily)